MKTNFLGAAIFLLLFSSFSIAQTNYINDVVLTSPIEAQFTTQGKVTTITDIVILAVDSGAITTTPSWVYNNVIAFSEDFIEASTYGNYLLNIVLLEDQPGQLFQMPNPYTVPFNGQCGSSATFPNGHVHNYFNIKSVLAQADARYDFNNYDYDGNGKVPIHFISIGPSSGGVICTITHNTNDTDGSGNPIQLVS